MFEWVQRWGKPRETRRIESAVGGLGEQQGSWGSCGKGRPETRHQAHQKPFSPEEFLTRVWCFYLLSCSSPSRSQIPGTTCPEAAEATEQGRDTALSSSLPGAALRSCRVPAEYCQWGVWTSRTPQRITVWPPHEGWGWGRTSFAPKNIFFLFLFLLSV